MSDSPEGYIDVRLTIYKDITDDGVAAAGIIHVDTLNSSLPPHITNADLDYLLNELADDPGYFIDDIYQALKGEADV